LVVGDVMIDRFIVGRVTRISPEAPVPIVRFESEYVRLGGAANVAHNLAVLGARASLVGIVGDDAAGRTLLAQLTAAGVNGDGLVVDLRAPLRGVAPGQTMVLYRPDPEGDDVIASATIASAPS